MNASVQRATRIEQAIARGWPAEQICAEMGVTREEVAAVWRAMDAAAAEQDRTVSQAQAARRLGPEHRRAWNRDRMRRRRAETSR